MKKVYVVYSDYMIHLVTTDEQKAKRRKKKIEEQKGLAGYTDTRVFIEEKPIE